MRLVVYVVPGDDAVEAGGARLADGEDELVVEGALQQLEHASALDRVRQVGETRGAVERLARLRVPRTLNAARYVIADLNGARARVLVARQSEHQSLHAHRAVRLVALAHTVHLAGTNKWTNHIILISPTTL